MYSILNTLSEYAYFYISKNITLCTFYLFLNSSKAFNVSLRCYYKNVFANSFFPRTASSWNCLARDYCPMVYDLNDFNSEQSEQTLLVFGLFLISFRLCLEFLPAIFSCNSIPFSGYSVLFVIKEKREEGRQEKNLVNNRPFHFLQKLGRNQSNKPWFLLKIWLSDSREINRSLKHTCILIPKLSFKLIYFQC